MYVYVETEILSSFGNSFVARNILQLSIVPMSITLKIFLYYSTWTFRESVVNGMFVLVVHGKHLLQFPRYGAD
jgi:hypothetical protein